MPITSIEWTDRTWNPVRGCSRVSEGCRNCYAEAVAARFSKPGLAFHGFAKVTAPRDHLDAVGGRRNGWTGKVELIPDKLAEPLSWRKPAKVFVNSMSDLFHEALPDEAIETVFGIMARAERHTFQILTKRPERMLRWFERDSDHATACGEAASAAMGDGGFSSLAYGAGGPWPPQNVWLGVSVEDQKTADKRIPLLLQTPAAVRFVSYEPALAAVDFQKVRWTGKHAVDVLRGGAWEFGGFPGFTMHSDMTHLDWVIVGGESGPNARPFDVAWARLAVEQCRAAGVACFVKQLGSRAYDREAIHRVPNPHGPIVGKATPEQLDVLGQMLDAGSMGVFDRKGGDPSEWPADLRVREFPHGA